MTESNDIITTESESILTDELETAEEIETFAPDQSNLENFVDTLPLMGKGMFGILLVTLIIIASVVILNKVTGGKKN